MARPRSWFESKEFNTAKKAAKTRGASLWKFRRPTRAGKPQIGYFVGTRIPVRLETAGLEKKL